MAGRRRRLSVEPEDRFGDLIVVRPEMLKRGKRAVLVECARDGNLRVVSLSDLVNGRARSCGCARNEWRRGIRY